MHAAYIPVFGLALAGLLLMAVRAAADRLLTRLYPIEVLDCAPLRAVDTILVVFAWAAAGLAVLLTVVLMGLGA